MFVYVWRLCFVNNKNVYWVQICKNLRWDCFFRRMDMWSFSGIPSRVIEKWWNITSHIEVERYKSTQIRLMLCWYFNHFNQLLIQVHTGVLHYIYGHNPLTFGNQEACKRTNKKKKSVKPNKMLERMLDIFLYNTVSLNHF